MRYVHRIHGAPEPVLAAARDFFAARGFVAETGPGDHARFTGPLGTVDLHVEIEGGHETCVGVSTTALAESDLDKRVKRFLSELHRAGHAGHAARGAY